MALVGPAWRHAAACIRRLATRPVMLCRRYDDALPTAVVSSFPATRLLHFHLFHRGGAAVARARRKNSPPAAAHAQTHRLIVELRTGGWEWLRRGLRGLRCARIPATRKTLFDPSASAASAVRRPGPGADRRVELRLHVRARRGGVRAAGRVRRAPARRGRRGVALCRAAPGRAPPAPIAN